MKRREALALFGGVMVTMAVGEAALANEAYPTKVVKILVPFGPGGSTDIIARLVGKQLETVTGQPFVIGYGVGVALRSTTPWNSSIRH